MEDPSDNINVARTSMPQQSPSEQLSLQVPLTPASKPQDKSQAPQQPDHRKTRKLFIPGDVLSNHDSELAQ